MFLGIKDSDQLGMVSFDGWWLKDKKPITTAVDESVQTFCTSCH
jgi:hypothetical protein